MARVSFVSCSILSGFDLPSRSDKSPRNEGIGHAPFTGTVVATTRPGGFLNEHNFTSAGGDGRCYVDDVRLGPRSAGTSADTGAPVIGVPRDSTRGRIRKRTG